MPEGKSISFAEGEYPELDGLESGTTVKFEGSATIEDAGDGSKNLVISSMEFETEGMADREFKKMRTQEGTSVGAGVSSEGYGEDF